MKGPPSLSCQSLDLGLQERLLFEVISSPLSQFGSEQVLSFFICHKIHKVEDGKKTIFITSFKKICLGWLVVID